MGKRKVVQSHSSGVAEEPPAAALRLLLLQMPNTTTLPSAPAQLQMRPQQSLGARAAAMDPPGIEREGSTPCAAGEGGVGQAGMWRQRLWKRAGGGWKGDRMTWG